MTGNRQGRKRLHRRGGAGTHGRQNGRGQGEGPHDQARQGRGRQDQPTGVQNSIQTVIESCKLYLFQRLLIHNLCWNF
jgi:hypothetical protein